MAKDPICGMTVDEKKALSLTFKDKAFFFCSGHCQKKFAQENHLPIPPSDSCAQPHQPIYKNKVFIIAALLIVLCVLANWVPVLEPFRNAIKMYFASVWWAIVLGLVLGGIVDYFIPREYIVTILAQKRRRTIFRAVSLGLLMSVCSHGILAIAIQLHKKGASTPAVIAFLMASPWSSLPITLLLISFFGAFKAFYIIFVALLIALVTGFVYQFLESKNLVEQNLRSGGVDQNFSIVADIKRRKAAYKFSGDQLKKDFAGIWQGIVGLSNMVLWWILIGIGLASLSAAYIPENIFREYMGPSLSGMLVTLAIATVVEVCSEGAAPLALEIYRQTGALGNSLIFLMAGVATDYTEIGLLWTNVGKKAAVWLPIIAVPQILFWGALANIIF